MDSYQATFRLENVGSEANRRSEDQILARKFTLTPHSPLMPIGRSSTRNSTRGKAQRDNALFNSPTVSRRHAELSIDHSSQTVFIKDLGSMHGTLVNGRELNAKEEIRLRQGALVTIGSNITQGNRVHPARTFRINYEWNPYSVPREPSVFEVTEPPAVKISHPPSKSQANGSFSVPDSDSEFESSDDDYDDDYSVDDDVDNIMQPPPKPEVAKIERLFLDEVRRHASNGTVVQAGSSQTNPLSIDEDEETSKAASTSHAEPHDDTTKPKVRTYIALSDLFNDNVANEEFEAVQSGQSRQTPLVRCSEKMMRAVSPADAHDYLSTPASSRSGSPDNSIVLAAGKIDTTAEERSVANRAAREARLIELVQKGQNRTALARWTDDPSPISLASAGRSLANDFLVDDRAVYDASEFGSVPGELEDEDDANGNPLAIDELNHFTESTPAYDPDHNDNGVAADEVDDSVPRGHVDQIEAEVQVRGRIALVEDEASLTERPRDTVCDYVPMEPNPPTTILRGGPTMACDSHDQVTLTPTVEKNTPSDIVRSASPVARAPCESGVKKTMKIPSQFYNCTEDGPTSDSYNPISPEPIQRPNVSPVDKSTLDERGQKYPYAAPYITPPKDSLYGTRHSNSSAAHYSRLAKHGSVFPYKPDPSPAHYLSGPTPYYDLYSPPSQKSQTSQNNADGMHEPHPYYPVHGLRQGSFPNYGYAPHASSSNNSVTGLGPSIWESRSTYSYYDSTNSPAQPQTLLGASDSQDAAESFPTVDPGAASETNPTESPKVHWSPRADSGPGSGQSAAPPCSRVSISSIIDGSSSPNSKPMWARSKRKVDDISTDDPKTTTSWSTVQYAAVPPSPNIPQPLWVCNDVPVTPQAAVPIEQQPQQPPRKKARFGSSVGPFALGVLVGSVGLFGALISLPESLF